MDVIINVFNKKSILGHHGWILNDSKMKIVSLFSVYGAPGLDSNEL